MQSLKDDELIDGVEMQRYTLEHLNNTEECLNSVYSHNRCLPIGQAFPQVLGNITEFRKNLMVAVQSDGQEVCQPTLSEHLHQPVEQLERQRQRNRQRMKNLRLDPEFRAQERLRQRQRMFLKRQDPQFREKERVLQRVRVREKRNMIRALESGNGLLERLTPPRTGPAHNSESEAANGSVTVYGTLVEGPQHLLLPNSFLVHSEASHYRHQAMANHNGEPDCQNKNFNFDLCRNNMLPNCKVCVKLYQDLSKHARGHKRNHRCGDCGRVFRLKQHLKGHMKSHGEKNLSCPHCPYRTCYNFALNRHTILKHSQMHQRSQDTSLVHERSQDTSLVHEGSQDVSHMHNRSQMHHTVQNTSLTSQDMSLMHHMVQGTSQMQDRAQDISHDRLPENDTSNDLCQTKKEISATCDNAR